MSTEPIHIPDLAGSSVGFAARGQGYFPVICALDEDECVAALRGGAAHIGIEGRLDLVRSTDRGATWDSPVTIADSERDDRNPALGLAADGGLVLAYHWQGSYDSEGKWLGDSQRVDTRVVYSGDRGHTWTDDALLDFQALNGESPFGKIRSVSSGPAADGAEMYMPIYGGQPLPGARTSVSVGSATCPTYLLRSRDGGRSWGDPILVAVGLNEADVLFLPDGDWLFAARSEDEAAIYTCRSSDRGETWADLQRVTEAREHPPDLTLLADGHILLNFGRRHPPFGVEGVLSSDGGRTWNPRRCRFSAELPGTDIGYASTARMGGGRLVTLFYSAGSTAVPQDTYNAIDVYCQAVCYDEAALLEAL